MWKSKTFWHMLSRWTTALKWVGAFWSLEAWERSGTQVSYSLATFEGGNGCSSTCLKYSCHAWRLNIYASDSTSLLGKDTANFPSITYCMFQVFFEASKSELIIESKVFDYYNNVIQLQFFRIVVIFFFIIYNALPETNYLKVLKVHKSMRVVQYFTDCFN